MLEQIQKRSEQGYKYHTVTTVKEDVAYLLGYVSREQEFKEQVSTAQMAYIMNPNKEGFDAFRKI